MHAQLLTPSDALQQPVYPDLLQLAAAAEQLRGMPGLVHPRVADDLKHKLAAGAFVIQTGDCVSDFAADTLAAMRRRVMVSGIMAGIIHDATGFDVVEEIREGPGKPRSEATEVVKGREVMTYRGPAVHGWDASNRTPDPWLMLEAYRHTEALHAQLAALGARHIYTAREALLIAMERSQVKGRYTTAIARPWVGLRTLDGPHLDFLAGIVNPIALKVGPGTKPARLAEAIEELDPFGTPGRLTLVMRLGVAQVAAALPDLIEVILASGRPVKVASDAMHGNTHKVQVEGKVYKTRFIEDIESEIEQVYRLLAAAGIPLSGVWTESSAYMVSECLSRNQPLSDLARMYTTRCDPRLNPSQCIQLAYFIANLLRS